MVTVGSTIGIYLITLISVSYGYWRTKWLNEAQRMTWARKVLLGAFKTVIVLAALYVFFWAATVASTGISNCCVSQDARVFVTKYVGLLIYIDNVTHLFVYLDLNPKFRNAFSIIFLGKQKNPMLELMSVTNTKMTKTTKIQVKSRIDVKSVSKF
jgi:hypothetical protein